ncbi:MAG: sodium:proton antiporter, partial [Acidimicrobiia bacterium]
VAPAAPAPPAAAAGVIVLTAPAVQSALVATAPTDDHGGDRTDDNGGDRADDRGEDHGDDHD